MTTLNAGEFAIIPELVPSYEAEIDRLGYESSKLEAEDFEWITAFFAKEENAKYKAVLKKLTDIGPRKFSYLHVSGVDMYAELTFYLALVLNKPIIDLEDRETKTLFHFLRQHDRFGQYLVDVVKNPHGINVSTSYFLKLHRALTIDLDVQRLYPRLVLTSDKKKAHTLPNYGSL